jgi:sugar phosphate isomerase/epimerase
MVIKMFPAGRSESRRFHAGRGKRIGACCDTGHWVRSGLHPVECLKKLEGRILGFHLKDVAQCVAFVEKTSKELVG